MSYEGRIQELSLSVSGTTTGTVNVTTYDQLEQYLTIEASSLDSVVNLELYQGNVDDITKMNLIVTEEIDNGYYNIFTDVECIYLGYKIDVLSATTGDVTITIKA